MIQTTRFDYRLADAQATPVEPKRPEDFSLAAYEDHEASRRQRRRAFVLSDSGVLVSRRMRVGQCFSYGCRTMEDSLAWQLGALAASMNYEADVPNFLEPWYGIGVVASAFGAEYVWEEGQSPAVRPRFSSSAEALTYPTIPVAETPIGRHILRMIDFFLDRTQGRLPMSLTDVQSPLAIACSLVGADRFCMDLVDEPEAACGLLTRASELLVEFNHQQRRRIGSALVWPGHGFASCREFQGLGISEDNVLLLSNAMYARLVTPSFEAAGKSCGGVAFHCCGNWSGKLPVVRPMAGLRTVDGAFSAATDPKPNPPEPLVRQLAGTGIVLNARMVGDLDTVVATVRQLWTPSMKLIVVTYCPTPAEQAEVHARIHEMCQPE